MCVYVHIYIYIYMCVCICIYIYNTCVKQVILRCIYMCIGIYMYIYVCTCIYMCIPQYDSLHDEAYDVYIHASHVVCMCMYMHVKWVVLRYIYVCLGIQM